MKNKSCGYPRPIAIICKLSGTSNYDKRITTGTRLICLKQV